VSNPLIDPHARLVIAHRGNGVDAPENTLEAFTQAVTLGADAIELDVRLTRDGVPVVLHDPSLYRTTGERDLVADLSLAQLRHADAGATFSKDAGLTFPYRARGLTVPTLAAALEEYPRIPLLIEVKIPDAVDATWRALEAAGATTRAVVGSLIHEAVAPFRVRSIPTGASFDEVLRLLPRAWWPGGPDRLPYQTLCIPRWYNGLPIPVVALARTAAPAGVVAHVWTVNSPRVAKRLWRAGIQGIVTDDPRTMLQARSELPDQGN
jgi:glycerophosphoryl diester phosphodiesterase